MYYYYYFLNRPMFLILYYTFKEYLNKNPPKAVNIDILKNYPYRRGGGENQCISTYHILKE